MGSEMCIRDRFYNMFLKCSGLSWETWNRCTKKLVLPAIADPELTLNDSFTHDRPPDRCVRKRLLSPTLKGLTMLFAAVSATVTAEYQPFSLSRDKEFRSHLRQYRCYHGGLLSNALSLQDLLQVQHRIRASSDVMSSLPGASPDMISAIADTCLLYTSPSPRDLSTSRMPSSA